jgi:multiple sugar transport system permease protein
VDSFIVALGSTVIGLALTLTASYSFSPLQVQVQAILPHSVSGDQHVPDRAPHHPPVHHDEEPGNHGHASGAHDRVRDLHDSVRHLDDDRFFPRHSPELDESAQIDGLGRLGTFVRASSFRSSLPGVSATGIYIFINAWNEFIYASILTSSAVRTIPVFPAEHGRGVPDRVGAPYGRRNRRGGTYFDDVLFIQKTMISGMTAGAVKG